MTKEFTKYRFFPSTDEEIIDSFKKFFNENGHYPSSRELDLCQYTPTSKTFQRRFGSLIAFRIKYSFGPFDFRSTQEKKDKTAKRSKESIKEEVDLFNFAKDIFKKHTVIREYCEFDDGRKRIDLLIRNSKKEDLRIYADIFNPEDIRSLIGSVNLKLRKYYPSSRLEPYKFFFVCANPKVDQYNINDYVERRKNKLSDNQKIITLSEFKKYLINLANEWNYVV
jgi:hypothetical protein